MTLPFPGRRRCKAKWPNWKVSLQEIEFSEVLGRLLTDGRLRDSFAPDRDGAVASLCHDMRLRLELSALKIEELEAQAEVLLRKRFDSVKKMIPGFVCPLETQAWPLFKKYARSCWRQGREDALAFARYAEASEPEKFDAREMNRLLFALGNGTCLKLHGVRSRGNCPALQILFRFRKRDWREWLVYLRF